MVCWGLFEIANLDQIWYRICYASLLNCIGFSASFIPRFRLFKNAGLRRAAAATAAQAGAKR